jgi:hypothetical protein
MRFKIFAFIWFVALAAAPITLSADTAREPAAASCDQRAAMPCCDEKPCEMPCCEGEGGCQMPCCNEQAAQGATTTEPSAIDLLFAMDPRAILPPQMEAPPVRQATTVWFHRPVWVGNVVLMGKHVIEHDTDRQARGEACTHIYAAGDLTTPVATFHCTHLDRDSVEKNTVVLRSLPDGMQRFLEFQFAGEHAAHGFPTDR